MAMFYCATILFSISQLQGVFNEQIAWNDTEKQTLQGVSSTGCPPQWQQWGAHCYLISGGNSTFSGAKLACESMRDEAPNSRLTTIHSQEENDFVASISSLLTYVWIGLQSIGADQEFEWVDNSTVVYTNWNIGEPNAADNCTEMLLLKAEHWWRTYRCTYAQHFVCKADLSNLYDMPASDPTAVWETTDSLTANTSGLATWYSMVNLTAGLPATTSVVASRPTLRQTTASPQTTTASPQTTTASPQTTTTSVNSREVPHYKIALLGNFTSSSGQPFDASCSSAYSQSLGVRAEGMRRTTSDLIGATLCSARVEGELLLSGLESTLTTNDTLGIVKISYYAEAVAHLSFDEVITCSQEISTYLLDHINWGYPILNGQPGCPFPDFHPVFFDGGLLWHCQLTRRDDAVNVDPLPEYEVNVKSNFVTQTGGTISTGCISQYSEDIYSKALSMVTALNSMLGSTLCRNQGSIEVSRTRTYFYAQSSSGDTTAIFSLASTSSALRFNEMMSCADEVEVFLRDHNNWGAPLLPQAPGCPFLVFDPAVFYPQGQSWYC